MKTIWLGVFILCAVFVIAACQSEQSETMVLLDEKIAGIEIIESKGFGGMNEEVLLSFHDKESLSILEKTISTARKQPGKVVDMTVPDYDVMIQYKSEEGDLPAHGIHLWLGDKGDRSTFMYINDDSVYHTSPELTKKLRELILSER